MGFNPKENYQKMKEYYEALNAKYDAYMKFIKFSVLLVGVVFSGWTAIEKMTAKEVQKIKDRVGISSNIEDAVHGGMGVRSGNGEKESYNKESVKDFKSQSIDQSLDSLVDEAQNTVYRRATHNWFWLIVFGLFGYLFVSHSVGQVKTWKWPRQGSSTGKGSGNEPK